MRAQEFTFDPEQDDAIEKTEIAIDRERLARALHTHMRTLLPREREVLALRFLQGKTLDQISAIMDVSRSRVAQIEARALRKMRLPSRSQYLEPFHDPNVRPPAKGQNT